MPLAEHRARTALYLRVIAEDPEEGVDVDTTEARILYVTKGGWGDKDLEVKKWDLTDGPWSPFKEFVVEASDELTGPYHEKAVALKARRGGGPMPAGICPTQFCKRAKFCQVHAECFSGQYPPGEGDQR
jgi:hypothetical protein